MRIVYTNLVDLAGTTITESDEVAGFESTNLQAVQPSTSWRIDSLDVDDFVDFDFGATYAWDVAWLGYTNAMAHRNLLRQSDEMDQTTEWPRTNLSLVTAGNPVLHVGSDESWQIVEDSTTGEHGIDQVIAWHTAGEPDVEALCASAYFAIPLSLAAEGIRVILSIGGADLRVDLDTGTGTLGSVVAPGSWSDGSATVEAITSLTDPSVHAGAWRVTLKGSWGSTNGDITLKLRSLKGGVVSHTGSQGWWVAGADVHIGTVAPAVVAQTTTDRAAVYAVQPGGVNGEADFAMSTQRNLQSIKDERGWVHFPAVVYDSVQNQQKCRFRLMDHLNLDGYFQAGRAVVGESVDYTGVTDGGVSFSREGAVRTLTVPLVFMSRAKAMGTLSDIYTLAGGTNRAQVQTRGGQIYRASQSPVLVILDEDETTYGEALTVYGFLDEEQPIAHRGNDYWFARLRITEIPK